jgi:preprotein translocase subunit SecY
MALGIMPYISASIIVQLMGMAIPYLTKISKRWRIVVEIH